MREDTVLARGEVRPQPLTRSHPRALRWFILRPACAVGLVMLGSGCVPPASQAERQPAPILEQAGDRSFSPKVTQMTQPVERDCGLPADLAQPDWPRRLEPTTAGPPAVPADGAVTVAVLPDTQYYTACGSDLLASQVRWLVVEKARRNIAVALSLGDLTEHNTQQEWEFVKSALRPLSEQIPFVLATGNHDHGDSGTANRRHTLLQQAFPEAPAATRPRLAEQMKPGDLENAYYRIPQPSFTLGILALEWSPRDGTVAWANATLGRYASDRVILVTHAFVYYDETRYDWEAKGAAQQWNPRSYGTALRDPAAPPGPDNWHPDGANDGEMLWDKLVRKHPGVFLTLSGHVLGDGQGLVASRGDAGNLVHQMLVNYQMLEQGGLGYLRLIELAGDGVRMKVSTYSPALDRTAVAPDQARVLLIDPPLRASKEPNHQAHK